MTSLTPPKSSGHWMGRYYHDDETCPVCGGPRNRESPLIVTDDAVYWQGKQIHFSTQERQYLQYLLLHRNKVVTKDALYMHLYSGLPDADWPEVKIVDVYICKIRRRLVAANIPVIIETFWGRGWMLKEDANAVKQLRLG